MSFLYQLISKKPKVYFIKLPQKEGYIYFDIIWPLGFAYSKNLKESSYKHLIEHIISALAEEKISPKGAFKGWVTDENIHFNCAFHKKNINLFSKILEVVFSSSFLDFQKYFDQEKKLAEDEEIKKQNDFYNQLEDIAIRKILDKNCIYYKCFLNKSLSYKFKTKELFNYYQRVINFEPIFFIGGDRVPKTIIQDFKNFCGSKKFIKNNSYKLLNCKIKTGLREIVRIKKEIQFQGVYFFIIFPMFSFGERVIFNFLFDILFHSQNKTEFNFKNFLRKKGFYNVFRNFVNYKKFSLIIIGINTSKKRIKELFLSLEEFFEKLNESQLDKRNFSRLKKLYINYYKNIFLENKERYEIITNHLVNYQKYQDPISFIKKLTSNKLQKLIKNSLLFDRINIIVIKNK